MFQSKNCIKKRNLKIFDFVYILNVIYYNWLAINAEVFEYFIATGRQTGEPQRSGKWNGRVKADLRIPVVTER